MVIFSHTRLREFYEKHADAKEALNNWFRLVETADWSDFHQVKDTFNSVDLIGNDRYVFNVRGNTYRIVVMIFFDVRTVYIRFVGTHAQYDKLCDSSRI